MGQTFYSTPQEYAERYLNNKTINKRDKQLSKDTKQTIISLAYTDILSSSDILELSEILLTISKYKTPNKKEGL